MEQHPCLEFLFLYICQSLWIAESALIGIETEQEEEGREHCQKSAEVQIDEDQQNPSIAVPSTPLGPSR